MREQPFAPVAPIAGRDDFAKVMSRATTSEFGLVARVFTKNATRTAEVLRAGMAGMNKSFPATA